MRNRTSVVTIVGALAAGAAGALTVTGAGAQVSQVGGIREARLSSQCQSIVDQESVTLTIGDARIRNGGAARVTGVRQSIFVEAGGSADVRGVGSTVYVARGGKATVGGVRSQVVAELGGSVVLVGSAIMTVVDTLDLRVHQNGADCR